MCPSQTQYLCMGLCLESGPLEKWFSSKEAISVTDAHVRRGLADPKGTAGMFRHKERPCQDPGGSGHLKSEQRSRKIQAHQPLDPGLQPPGRKGRNLLFSSQSAASFSSLILASRSLSLKPPPRTWDPAPERAFVLQMGGNSYRFLVWGELEKSPQRKSPRIRDLANDQQIKVAEA